MQRRAEVDSGERVVECTAIVTGWLLAVDARKADEAQRGEPDVDSERVRRREKDRTARGWKESEFAGATRLSEQDRVDSV